MSAWDDLNKKIDDLFEKPNYVPKGRSVWIGIELIRKIAKAAGYSDWNKINEKDIPGEEQIKGWIHTCVMRTDDYYALAKLYYSDMDNADVGRG